MATEKTSVSVYRLLPSARGELERRFISRTPLQNGLEGWFHLVEPDMKEPAWLRAIEPHLGAFSTARIRTQVPAGLAFIVRGGAEYVITFGFAWIYLDATWLEPDFGRRVALNAVPPNKVLELNSEQVFARWHVAKERSPRATSFKAFGVELDRDLVAALEGIPSDPLFGGTVRGSTSLRMKIPFHTLPKVLDRAEILFASNGYKRRWPEVDNLTPVSEPATIAQLDAQLDKDMKAGKAEADITMFAPSFRRGESDPASSFVLGRLSKNPATTPYLQYSLWKQHLDRKSSTPSVKSARETRVHMLDHGGDAFESRTIYECLGYELSLSGQSYVLSSGIWYRAEAKFTASVDATLTALAATGISLPVWNETSDEGTYNESCGQRAGMLLLDKKIVHFGGGQSKFEFCDFIHIQKRTLFCAKIPSRSSDCSHLVEQSKRTLELFFSSDPSFRMRAKDVLKKSHATTDLSWLDARPRSGDWRMCLVLMGKKIDELPLFARCSIARLAKYCDEHGHPLHVQSV